MRNLKKIICLVVSSIILDLPIIFGQNLSDGGFRQSFERLDSALLAKLTLNSSPLRSGKETIQLLKVTRIFTVILPQGKLFLKQVKKFHSGSDLTFIHVLYNSSRMMRSMCF